VTNTLAYYGSELIATVKSFIVQVSGVVHLHPDMVHFFLKMWSKSNPGNSHHHLVILNLKRGHLDVQIWHRANLIKIYGCNLQV
jgi:hypothetical protein